MHLATQLGMGEFAKPLVLKLLLPHLAENPRAVEMFLTEARLASRMNHPNVVHIFDVGVIEHRYFIAMELVRGVAMSKLLKALRFAGRQLEPELVLFIARCLCDGLHHAHEQRGPDGRQLGLIHRDVTPENVLLGVEGQVKLTDFGVARAKDQRADDHVVGKFGYIAPEHAAGKEIDRRADVFSTAVTIFCLATGLKPFQRETRAETVAAVRDQPLPQLRGLRPDLPDELGIALERATRKDPRERFATAKELRDALPPTTLADASERLGALLLQLCGDQLSALDASLEKTTSLRAGTQQLSPSPVSSSSAEVTRPRQRSRWLAAIPPLAAAAIFGGIWVWLHPPRTVEEPAPAPVQPPVAVVIEAEPVPPAPAPAVEQPPAPAPAPVPPPPRKAASRPPKRVTVVPPEKIDGEPGFVVVDANPWAHVSINGKQIGETPIAGYPLAPGPAVVKLENPETGKSLVQHVKVLRGQRAYVKGDLR